MDLDGFDARPMVCRRDKLARQLGSDAALVPSGAPSPRNYAANAFPFRAASHFLYLFGRPLRNAFGLWDGQSWSVFLEPPTADDALWHGAEPGLDELSRVLQCAVKPLSDLSSCLEGRSAATVPAPDLRTCAEQSRLLGRSIAPGTFDPIDHPLVDALIALRLVHDEAAITEMRKGAEASSAAHHAGMRTTRPGMREWQVRAAMEHELMARGMTVAYGSIVTVHGEVLHNEAYHHVLGDDDMILADVGAETDTGWASDVTRTWPVAGRYSPTQRDFYDLVLAAQKATIAAVKPGTRYRDLHLLASRTFAEGLIALGILRGDPTELVMDGVVALLFPHGIGHLLGLDVHDMEDLGDRAGYQTGRRRAPDLGLRYLRLDRDLQPGMAITVEPGLYMVPAILDSPTLGSRPEVKGRLDRTQLARFSDVRGIRIEDDVLVTATGCEVLTAAIPKERADVEAVMASRPSLSV